VDHGSRFHFTANFQISREAQARTPVLKRLAGLRGLTVLVVDDNATNRRILEEMLKNWGMSPKLVENAREALAELHRAAEAGRHYPLVLLDFMMPEMNGLTLAEKMRSSPELLDPAMLLLTSGPQASEMARAREIGIAAILTKPVKQSELLDAIRNTIHTDSIAELGSPIDRRDVPARPRRSLAILVAEDNAINQRVVMRLLEKRGHRVTVVSNGNKALAALSERSFDLALMDVQMPELSGIEATRLIRERERSGKGHLPIIAMTAHAMKGDRERCLQAGMDGYVAKPVQPRELLGALNAVLPQCESEPAEPAGNLNEGALLARVGNDLALLEELVDLFEQDSPRLLAALHSAIMDRANERLIQAAHTLKGSLAYLGADSACDICRRLEALGKADDHDTAARLYEELAEAIRLLRPALADLIAKSVAL
jgi:CheY-like chemotaxis protein/HPt (histidine-containing phosphotransfer) domain-containing protein